MKTYRRSDVVRDARTIEKDLRGMIRRFQAKYRNAATLYVAMVEGEAVVRPIYDKDLVTGMGIGSSKQQPTL